MLLKMPNAREPLFLFGWDLNRKRFRCSYARTSQLKSDMGSHAVPGDLGAQSEARSQQSRDETYSRVP